MKKLIILSFIIFLILGGCETKVADDDTLRIMHAFDKKWQKPSVDWLKDIGKQFTKKHPKLKVKDIGVNWREIDLRAYMDYKASISNDVIFTSPQYIPKHEKFGDCLELSKVKNWDKETEADFDWNEVYTLSKKYAIPISVHARMCAYRKDIFKKHNITKLPRTLEELVEVGKKLTTDKMKGIGIYLGGDRATAEVSFAPILWNWDGKIFDEKTGKATFANDAGIKTAQYIHDLIYKHKVTSPRMLKRKYKYDDFRKDFLDGKFAIAIGWGSYWLESLEKKGWIKGCYPPSRNAREVTVGFFPYPTKKQESFLSSWNLSIHKISSKKKEAMEIINMMVKAENLAKCPEAKLLPPRKSMWNTPSYRTSFYQKWYKMLVNGRNVPKTIHYEELRSYINVGLRRVLLEKKPLKETLENLQSKFNNRYTE